MRYGIILWEKVCRWKKAFVWGENIKSNEKSTQDRNTCKPIFKLLKIMMLRNRNIKPFKGEK